MPTVRRNSCEKIMGFGENVAKMKRGTIDRISELPDFILHNILSMLDTKDAGRASVLSKRWYFVWSSIPVLDFRPQHFKEVRDRIYNYDNNSVQRFVGFIEKTMQRYLAQKYRIREMYLMLPEVDEKLKNLVDKWIMIAVENQIQKLEIQISSEAIYWLPEILFCAKSLKYLVCMHIGLPYYETMELISLEYLILDPVTLDDDMLQKIISSCPLFELHIINRRFGNSLPWLRKVDGVEGCSRDTIQSYLASPLQKFVYTGLGSVFPWPWNMNVVSLKNLRKLEICWASITGDIVSELASGLIALESLVLESCLILKCIKISSISLKEFRIGDRLGLMKVEFPNEDGLDLMKVTVDAPNLLDFSYGCKMEASLTLIRVPDHCNTHFSPLVMDSLTTVWFVKLKKFLTETNFFKSLVMDVLYSNQTVVEEDQLNNVVTGPPYKLRELNLLETRVWESTESSLTAFLDGLFWCCHPDVLSITTILPNSVVKLMLSILRKKVHCWKDPLKSIEVEGFESARLISPPYELEIKLRLSW